ncbi:actin cytoskeleton organization protein [Leucosporidium creatinivorum]|uniref:Actin cytoskeleton organization protein n=1 Tax=Leucosporidium creatinivorum TaxID=106004 RepID=A0A1Y2ELY1_9BASI|nr:actin cytoskeleton organization protein [Leucosporidium creatinivorum]
MSIVAQLVNNLLVSKKLSGALVEYRAIQPICSALEVASYKTALLGCAKLLKKQPDHATALALKTLALAGPRPVSSAAQQEIVTIVESVKNQASGAGLADPEVLQILAWVMGGLGRGEETLALFAKATEKHPKNETVSIEAFLHYVRVGERRSAQQISMRMQRNFKNEKYTWWSVMATLLQARDVSDPSTDILLALAERQISDHYSQQRKAAGLDVATPNGAPAIEGAAEGGAQSQADAASEKGKGKESAVSADSAPVASGAALEFDSAHEYFLITRFLELRALRHEAKAASATAPANADSVAVSSTSTTSQLVLPSITPSSASLTPRQAFLAHFASKEGDKWCAGGLGLEIWRRETELRFGSIEGGEWVKSWERLSKSLEDGETNWHTMLYLIRCTFAVADRSSKALFGVEEFSAQPSEEGAELISKSRALFRGLADNSPKGKVERGFLLGLLEIARESRRRKWEEADPLLPTLEEYFERFSTKMCCFDDLLPYLQVLNDSERTSLFEKMTTIAEVAGDLSITAVYRVINASKVARFVATVSDAATQLAAAEGFVKRYFQTLPLGKGLPPTDLQPADDFALLAGQAFVAAWQYSRDRSCLERALVVLEYGLQRSKHKYQIRILAINILRLLGASSSAIAHFRILNPKAIQNDTLSHLVLNRAATFAVTQDAAVLEEAVSASKWYKTGEHEAAEMAVRVFSYHNYSKIEEFIVFQDRLTRSLNKYLLQIESMRMRVLRGLLDPALTTEAVGQLTYTVENRTTELFDNRDYKTLPNHQAKNEPSIWEQTQMGPKTQTPWLRAFTAIYSNFLNLKADLVEGTDINASELTPSEAALLKLSSDVRAVFAAALDDSEPEQNALAFFKIQTTLIEQALEDSGRLPWEVLQIAEIALEGYCLLDLAIEQRTIELAETKAQDHAKHSKRLRNFRIAARDLTRTVGARVTAHGKKVAKERPKTVTSVSSLKQFPLLDDDHLLNFSHALVESRRAMAEGLGAAIHRRCIK